MTSKEVVQQAIDSVKMTRRRERLQAKFDADPDGFILKLSKVLKLNSDPEARKVGAAIGVGAIDPEKLARWIEIIMKVLPLILALL